MTHATRAESLSTAIAALGEQAQVCVDRSPNLPRQLEVAGNAGNAQHIADSEEVCRAAIERLTGARAHKLSVHEVSVLFGLSVTRLNRPWLSDYRKAHPDRVSGSGPSERLYRLDDMLKLREAYRQRAAGAAARAAEARYGSEVARRNKAHHEDLDRIRRRLNESKDGKLKAATQPHIEALLNLGCFVQRCAESVVYATTQPLDFLLDADGVVVDSGVWPMLSSDEITDVLMEGGSLVGLTLHDALCLRWTDAKRVELWAELWKLGLRGTDRLMAEGQAEGRQTRSLSKATGDQTDR